MKAAVLAYGYDSRAFSVLRTVCARLDIRPRRVDISEQDRPVGSFFGLVPDDGPAARPAGPIPGRMLVLAGLTARQMDAFLSALRTARAGDSLKAVLTEYNADWTGPALYAELAEEHRRMQAAAIDNGARGGYS